MYFAQTGILVPTALVEAGPVQLPASARRLEVRTPHGEILVGVRIQATGEEAERAPTLLGFGGNAWNAEAMALHLHGLFPNREVVAFHYRGYAPSGGMPSAEALLSDSVLIFDHLRQAHARERVVAIGFSIGSGVAAYLARNRPAAGLILVTPFDSLKALARDLYWWAPIGLLLRHRMPTIDFVRGSPVPTALVVAERDTIVPARRSMALRPAIANLVFEGSIEAGHNDLYGHPAFAAAMREALATVEAVSGQAFGR
jgi:pimeloyl-ACP methyl ester carboxylesterase